MEEYTVELETLRRLVEGLLKCLELTPHQRKLAREYLDACDEVNIRLPRET